MHKHIVPSPLGIIICAMNNRNPQTLYESFFENTLDGFAYCQMIFNAEGRPIDFTILWTNKNFEKLSGLKNVDGKRITDLIPTIASSNPEVFEICGRVSLTGRSERFEAYVKPISQWFSVLAYSPEKNFFVGIFQNITNRKQAEKDLENAQIATRNVLEDLRIEKDALAHAKAKYEAILANIGEGLAVTDLDRRIILINTSGEQMLGWNADELLGKDWFDIVKLKDDTGHTVPLGEAPLQKVLTDDATVTVANYSFTKKDGTAIPVAITASRVFVDKKLIGAIIVFRDISKEKAMEKLRLDFLSLASHQLRTPLSGTKWLIDTMKREILGSMTLKQKEYIDYLYQINERMIRLVSDMLNVLILESGEAVIENQETPISKICEELSFIMKPAARNKGVLLRNACSDHMKLFIQTNSQALRTILESFVSNAINYSKSGQEVVLDAKEEPAAIIFSVKDSGIGIPQEEQKQIFERFYRASNAKEFMPDGTGLGLYIASMLSKKMGAEISFESETNKGTVFYLRVPKKVG